MKEKTQQALCFALTFFNVCFAVTVSIYMFMLTTQVANLQKDLETLRQITNQKEVKSEPSKGDDGSFYKHGQRRSTFDSNGFLHDLLLTQERILESHCSNNTKFCMRGEKGDRGEKGEKGDPTNLPSLTSQCECLQKPKIIKNVTSTLNVPSGQDLDLSCKVTGNPPARVTWEKDGTRMGFIGEVLHLTNVQSSGTYKCTAQSVIGSDTLTFNLNTI